MNKLFRMNYSKLKKSMPKLIFEKEEYDIKSEDSYYCDENSKIWNLQSKIDMEFAVSTWCDQFEEASYMNIFMIFGFGDARYIRELVKRHPENIIIIYEPSESILAQQMCKEDLSDIIENEKIKIVAGKRSRFNLEYSFKYYVTYANLDNMIHAALPNYLKMFEEEYDEYLRQIKELVHREVITRNTRIKREEFRGRNFLYNLERFWMESGVVELGNAISDLDIKQCPAVLVSAGPSLDKNIDILKKYQGRVFIVCVDAAIRATYKHGIKPDLIVTQDPKFADPTVFENEYGQNIPTIVSMTSDIKVVEKIHGRKFYIYEEEFYIDKLLENKNCELYGLPTGGSVANTAFSFLKNHGRFTNIILIGQDLGYTGNRLHASDVFYDEGNANPNDEHLFYVESIDGGEVLTEDNMNMYRLWFENIIADNENMNVIDATEGGALIHGSKIMTLKDALETYAMKEKMDIGSLVEKANYLLDDNEKKEVQNRINKSYNDINRIIRELEAQEHVYDRLDMLNRKRKYSSKEFKDCIDKIGEFHERMQEDEDIDLIRIYTNRGEYAAMEELQTKESNTYDEIKLVIDSGRKLLQSYIEGAKKLQEEWMKVRQK